MDQNAAKEQNPTAQLRRVNLQTALAHLQEAAYSGQHFLVYGPAQSGKSEVLVRACAAVPDSVLLVPSQGRVATLRARLEKSLWQDQPVQTGTKTKAPTEPLNVTAPQLAGPGAVPGALATLPVVTTLAGFIFSLVNKQRRREQQTPVRLAPETEFLTWLEQNLRLQVAQGQEGTASSVWPQRLHLALTTPQFAHELLETMNRVRALGMSETNLEQFINQSELPGGLRECLQGLQGQMLAARRAQEQRASESLQKEWALDTAAKIDYYLALPDEQIAADVPPLVAIDDLQDMSEQAVLVISRWARLGARIVAASHPEVSVASYRSALPWVMTDLAAQLFPKPTVISLDFGSWPPDLAQVHAAILQRIESGPGLAQRWPLPNQGPQVSVDHQDCLPLQLLVGRSHSDHLFTVIKALEEEHVRHNVAWENMAIIVRREADVTKVCSYLRNRNIPHQAPRRTVLLKTGRVSGVLLQAGQIICSSAAPSEDLIGELLVSRLGQLAPWQLRQIRQAALAWANRQAHNVEQKTDQTPVPDPAAQDTPLVQVFTLVGRAASAKEIANELPKLADETRERFWVVAHCWNQAHQQWQEDPGAVRPALWTLWEGLVDTQNWQNRALDLNLPIAVRQAENEDLDQVMDLFKAAEWWEERNPGGQVADFFSLHLDSELPTNTVAKHAADSPGIAVLTPGQAAGRSWEVVAVASLLDGVWPNATAPDGMLGLSARQLRQLRQGTPTALDYHTLSQENWYNEYRLFANATSRARQKLFLATALGAESPSSFLENLATDLGWDLESLTSQALQRQFTPGSLTDLVGRLRRQLEETALGGTESPLPASVKTAGRALAYLAKEGIAGAHPHSWLDNRPAGGRPWDPGQILPAPGRLEKLDVEVDPDRCIFISASGLARWLENPLQGNLGAWGLEDESRDDTAALIGTVVHKVAEEVGKKLWPRPGSKSPNSVSEAEISAQVDEAFAQHSGVLAGVGQRQAHARAVAAAALENLKKHFSKTQFQLPSEYEMPFVHAIAVPMGQTTYWVVYRGFIDRVLFGQDEQGRPQVMALDYKIAQPSSYPPKSIPSNLQLALYQAALAHKYPHHQTKGMLVMLKTDLAELAQPSLNAGENIELDKPFSAQHLQLLQSPATWPAGAGTPRQQAGQVNQSGQTGPGGWQDEDHTMGLDQFLQKRLQLTVAMFEQREVAQILTDYRDDFVLKMRSHPTMGAPEAHETRYGQVN